MDAPTTCSEHRTTRTPSDLIRIATRIALGAVALAVTLALTALILLPHVGARGLIVTSGSMGPDIGTGDLAVVLTVDPASIRPGDVITYAGYTSSGLTTHRVVRALEVGGRLHFQTKGDANDAPDADLAPAEGVRGRVVVAVPHAGRVLALLADPTPRLLALGLPAAWLFLRCGMAMAQALRSGPARSGAPEILLVALLVLAGATSLAHRLDVSNSAALLTDAVSITENTFSTGSWI